MRVQALRKLTMIGRCPGWLGAIAALPSLMLVPALAASDAQNMVRYGTDNLKLLGPIVADAPVQTDFYSGSIHQSDMPGAGPACGPTILTASGAGSGCAPYPAVGEPAFSQLPSDGIVPGHVSSPAPTYARRGFGRVGQGASGFAQGVDFKPYATLRGGMENDSASGQNFVVQTEAGFDADIYSALGNYTLGSKILLANPAGKSLAFSSFTNSLVGKVELSSLTNLDIGGRLEILRESVGDEDLPATTVAPPYYLVGALSGAIGHQFGRFTLTPNVMIERFVYGETELTGGAKLANKDRQYWHGQLGLRTRYEVSPRLAALGDIFTNASWFDQKDRTTGLSRDVSSLGLRVGFEGAWLPQLQIGGGVSASVDRFSDGSDGGDPNWMFDGYLTYVPNDDVTLAATLSSEIAPTEIAGARRRVTTKLDLQLSYLSTQDLTLRAYINGDQSRFVGLSSSSANAKIGAGLDYFLSDFVTGTVDLSAAWAMDENSKITDKQAIMVGVTVRP